ncbi:MAG: hypothetical protein QM496_07595 [Verrucomicrobiota bacterium]
MKASLVVLITVMALQIATARDFRELTNLEGKKIKAELLDLKDGKLKIRANSRVFEVPVDKLSQADQDFLTEWEAVRKGDEEQLYYKELVFEDDFSGEEFGELWKHYKSESVVKDGVMIGKTVDIKVHAGCDSVRFEGRRDMEVAVKFNFVGEEAERFNVWFDDKDYKESHAGHISSISISPTSLAISDAKTGNFKNEIYEKRKSAEGLDEATQEMLKSKTVRFDLDLKREKWHELLIRTKADKLVVKIDGKEVGAFQSEGVAHMTKSLVSLTTNVNDVHYDDLVIKSAPNSAIKEDQEEAK